MIDFDKYWAELRDEHRSGRRDGRLDWELIPRNQIVERHGLRWRVDWLRFSSVNDSLIHGWVASPVDHEPNRVGFLWLPGYSYGTPRPDETNLLKGVVTLCINVHGNKPDDPYVNPAGKSDYIVRGIDHPQTYIYRTIVLHCLHAMDIVAELDGIDSWRTVVGGMSQGGALSLLVAANHDSPAVCFADMPFLCSIRSAIAVSHSPAYKTLTALMKREPDRAHAVLDTVCLFDPLLHAQRIRIPTSLCAGGKDPNSPVATIQPVYAAIASTIKQLRVYPDAGHVFLPQMVQTYTEWIERLVLDRTDPGYV